MIKDRIDSDHVAAICQQLRSSSKTAQALECLKSVLDTDKHVRSNINKAPSMASICIEKA